MKFIKQLFRRPKETGAVAPSSRFLARKMIAPIPFDRSTHIVELGPGTGVITKHIMENLGVQTRFTIIENNEEFVQPLLNISDPRLRVFLADAKELPRFVDAADTIISSIPLGALSSEDVDKFLSTVAKTPGLQKFVQFQYSKLREKHLRKHFDIKKSYVLFNIPPAIVYTCTPKIRDE